MKVLFVFRDNSLTCPAGDSVQMRETLRALKALGVNAQSVITSELKDLTPEMVAGLDRVHLFDLIPVEETLRQAAWARQAGKPVALSTIYWDPGEFFDHDASGLTGREWWERTAPMRRELIAMCDLLLPNSAAETALLVREFGPETASRCVVVPNAVDPSTLGARPEAFRRRLGHAEPFVLCVARVVRRKNQLALIQALRGTGLRLVLAGPPNDPVYERECRQAAGPEVCFAGALTSSETASAYAAARVHVLPSWYDTPGLVSLEAGLQGCRVVTTDRGPSREYFGDRVWYCSPTSPESIRRAVLAAWHSPGVSALQRHILDHFTWEKAALATLSAYKKAGAVQHLRV